MKSIFWFFFANFQRSYELVNDVQPNGLFQGTVDLGYPHESSGY